MIWSGVPVIRIFPPELLFVFAAALLIFATFFVVNIMLPAVEHIIPAIADPFPNMVPETFLVVVLLWPVFVLFIVIVVPEATVAAAVAEIRIFIIIAFRPITVIVVAPGRVICRIIVMGSGVKMPVIIVLYIARSIRIVIGLRMAETAVIAFRVVRVFPGAFCIIA